MCLTYLLDEPRDFFPGVGFAMPYGRVDPFSRVLLELFSVFAHKDRVRFSDLVPHLCRILSSSRKVYEVEVLTEFG